MNQLYPDLDNMTQEEIIRLQERIGLGDHWCTKIIKDKRLEIVFISLIYVYFILHN